MPREDPSATKRVLIVEDDRDLGRLLEAALETFDTSLSITVVPSAEEAALEVARTAFDLMVTDIRLPGVSGLELVRKVKLRNPQMRVIAITGLRDPQMEEQATQLKIDVFLRKPLTISEFIHHAALLLGARVTGTLGGKEKSRGAKPNAQVERMGELLAGLRHELDACIAALIDERGKVLFHAGEFPEPGLEAEWVPAWLETLQAAGKAGVKLGRYQPASILVTKSAAYDCLLAPMGLSFGLFILLRPSRSTVRLALGLDVVLAVHTEIQAMLEGMGLSLKPAVAAVESILPPQPQPTAAAPAAEPEDAALPPPVEEETEAPAGFAELFTAPSMPQADAFWEAALEEDKPNIKPPNMLTYEEARGMGLLPEEPQGET